MDMFLGNQYMKWRRFGRVLCVLAILAYLVFFDPLPWGRPFIGL